MKPLLSAPHQSSPGLRPPTAASAALLIDGENISAGFFEEIVRQASAIGLLKRLSVHGDLGSPLMSSWRALSRTDKLGGHAGVLQHVDSRRIQNAADHAIVVEASKLYFSGDCDTIVIASNDKGFVQLARQLRQSGARVVGVGTQPPSHVLSEAYDKFLVAQHRMQCPTKEQIYSGVISLLSAGWAFVRVPRISRALIPCRRPQIGLRIGYVVRVLLRQAESDGINGEVVNVLAR